MTTLVQKAKMTVASAPHTSAFHLDVAYADGFTFPAAGVPDGASIIYAAYDGVNFEQGEGVWTQSTKILTRDVVALSSENNNKVDFSASTYVYAVAIADLAITNPSYGSLKTNLVFDPATAALRITGDMSNATINSRFGFVNILSNQPTWVHAFPNGSSTTSGFSAESDAAGAGYAATIAAYGAEARLESKLRSTGTGSGYWTIYAQGQLCATIVPGALSVPTALVVGGGTVLNANQLYTNSGALYLQYSGGILATQLGGDAHFGGDVYAGTVGGDWKGFYASSGAIVATLRTYETGGYGLVGTDTNHGFRVRTNTVDRIVITNDGKVGIGTGAPIFFPLAVHTGTNRNITFRPASDFNSGWAGALLQGVNDANSAWLPLGLEANPVAINAATQFFVGIGTFAPAAALHVCHDLAEVRIQNIGTGGGILKVYNDGNGHINADAPLYLNYVSRQAIYASHVIPIVTNTYLLGTGANFWNQAHVYNSYVYGYLIGPNGAIGTYGALSVFGSKAGYTGLEFLDSDGNYRGNFMVATDVSNRYVGYFNYASTWDWGFLNGVMFAGSVNASFITGGTFTASNRFWFKDVEGVAGVGLRVGGAWGLNGIYSETGHLAIGSVSGYTLIQNANWLSTAGFGFNAAPLTAFYSYGSGQAAGFYQLNSANGSIFRVFDDTNSHIETTTALWINQLSAAATYMSVGGGNVSIGTTAQYSKLSVNGAISLIPLGPQVMAPYYMLYGDASDFYILLTDSATPTTSANARRPFYIEFATGTVNMGHGFNLNGGALNILAGTIGLEHGAVAVTSTPFIDFHTSGTGNDYDTRLIADGGSSTVGQGRLLFSGAQFGSAADGVNNLGSASTRWGTVYAATSAINTSDGRDKTPMVSLTRDEIDAARDLVENIDLYQWLSSIEEKGAEAARRHVGMPVQSAIKTMQDHGLDPFRYGFICYDKWDEEEATFTEKGKQARRARAAGDHYGFRHDQMLMFMLRGMSARLRELESRLPV